MTKDVNLLLVQIT